jgi:hypothetical protein
MKGKSETASFRALKAESAARLEELLQPAQNAPL